MISFSKDHPRTRGEKVYIFRTPPAGKDHPRTRGEKKSKLFTKPANVGSPPHTRGKGSRPVGSSDCRRITPAHAGKRRIRIKIKPTPRDHPRTRGEKAGKTAAGSRRTGSPPHTRGKGQTDNTRLRFTRITPAHAGKRTLGFHFA